MLILSLVAEALINNLWQGGAIAIATLAALALIPRSQASLRLLLRWFGAALVVVLLALSLWTSLPAPAPPVLPTRITPEVSVPQPPTILLGWPLLAMLGVVALAALLLLSRVGRSYLRICGLKRRSRSLEPGAAFDPARWEASFPQGRFAALRLSGEVAMPVLAGLRSPMILLPDSLPSRLTASELYLVWLHETAHLRRFDDWAQVAERVLRACFFFHPAILLLLRGMEDDRELACDAWVVRYTGATRLYAECLYKLATDAGLALPALGAGGSKKQILKRMECLMQSTTRFRKLATMILASAAAAVLTVCAGVLTLAGPLILVDLPASAMYWQAPQAPPVPLEAPPAPVAPVPPAPPAPAAEPALPASPANAEAVRALHEEMQRLSDQIREEVEQSIRPKQMEIRRLSNEIRDKVRAGLGQQSREVARTARELAALRLSDSVNASEIARLEAEMKAHEAELANATSEIHGLEEPLRQMQEQIRIPQERLEEFSRRMLDLQRRIEEQIRQHRERLQVR